MSTPAIDLNDQIRYTNWTVFERISELPPGGEAHAELEALVASWAKRDITLRGAYDLRGFRAESDLMLWIHAPSAELVQDALREWGATSLGRHFTARWSGMGLHRPAEFNRGHVPGFMRGLDAQQWICVYPFVRSYDWYLLPEAERREMLVEHGKAGQVYDRIVSNTVASFALGDWEWILALESPVLHDLVDMMRDLRYTEARRHVREEVPFFTGQRIDFTELQGRFS
jgi:chlorite dismutase